MSKTITMDYSEYKKTQEEIKSLQLELARKNVDRQKFISFIYDLSLSLQASFFLSLSSGLEYSYYELLEKYPDVKEAVLEHEKFIKMFVPK